MDRRVNTIKPDMDNISSSIILFPNFSLRSPTMSDNDDDTNRDLEALARRIQQLEWRTHDTRHELWSSLHNWEEWKLVDEHKLLVEVHEQEWREVVLVQKA